jgi:hypothetical protein
MPQTVRARSLSPPDCHTALPPPRFPPPMALCCPHAPPLHRYPLPLELAKAPHLASSRACLIPILSTRAKLPSSTAAHRHRRARTSQQVNDLDVAFALPLLSQRALRIFYASDALRCFFHHEERPTVDRSRPALNCPGSATPSMPRC